VHITRIHSIHTAPITLITLVILWNCAVSHQSVCLGFTTVLLDSLEAHASATYIPLNDLPAYVLWYCHHRIHNIIDSSKHWAQHDWSVAWSHLINLYGSNDQKSKSSPNHLQKWVKLHIETCSITRLQDVDRYYWEFMARSTELIAGSLITNNEANLLFYKGIPSKLQRIKQRIPQAHQMTLSPPSITSVISYLRDKFDEDDIDGSDNDIDFYLDLLQDTDTSDIDNNCSFHIKPQCPQRKQQVPSALDVLVSQLQEQIQGLKNKQVAILWELTTTTSPTSPNEKSTNEKRCFICDQPSAHQLGPCYCPQVPILINEGLASYNKTGQLTCQDSSELPHAPYGSGGVAKALCKEHQPPSITKFAKIQYDGMDLLTDNVYVLLSISQGFNQQWRFTFSRMPKSVTTHHSNGAHHHKTQLQPGLNKITSWGGTFLNKSKTTHFTNDDSTCSSTSPVQPLSHTSFYYSTSKLTLSNENSNWPCLTNHRDFANSFRHYQHSSRPHQMPDC